MVVCGVYSADCRYDIVSVLMAGAHCTGTIEGPALLMYIEGVTLGYMYMLPLGASGLSFAAATG